MRHYNADPVPRDITDGAEAPVSKRRLSTPQVLGVIAGLATAGIAAGVGSVGGHTSHSHGITLEQELDSAYTHLDITSVKDTKIIVMRDTARRDIIDFTVDAQDNPKALYSAGPTYWDLGLTGTMVAPNGTKVQADVSMVDARIGTAQEAVDLSPFTGSTPFTETLRIDENKFGINVPGNTELDATYYAGSIRITGENGDITSVQLVHEDLPPVQITELPSTQQ
jgi:hypothetical protein